MRRILQSEAVTPDIERLLEGQARLEDELASIREVSRPSQTGVNFG